MSLVERALAKAAAARPADQSVNPAAQVSSASGETSRTAWATGGDPARSPGIAEFQHNAAGTAAGMWRGGLERALHSQLHGLRREILDAVVDVKAKGLAPVILVTSAIPGDGKTFISLGLAKVLSSVSEFTTTLVDADLIRARMSGIWGLQGAPGLAECIRGELAPRDALHVTKYSRVEVIGAGNAESDVAEELAGMSLKDVLASLRDAGVGRLFVVDAPPLLSVAETLNIARCADLVVMVVRANSTPLPAVREALGLLEGMNVAVALNGASADSGLLDGGYYKGTYERE